MNKHIRQLFEGVAIQSFICYYKFIVNFKRLFNYVVNAYGYKI